MKSLAPLSCMLVVVGACGARTSMETCAEGATQCPCIAGACNPGLVCVDDVCRVPGILPAGSGGTVGSGGVVGSGGQVGSGGYVGSGGVMVSGGIVGSGGYIGDGGRVGSGGVVVSGGIFSSGGYSGGGGRVGTGGVTGMSGGGRSGFGGSTAFVTFMNGQATGLMDGWGWASLGVKDSLYSPTCAGQPITSTTPCTTMTTWSSNNELCVTGMIPALPPSPTTTDYNDNWGIMVAANCVDPPGPIGISFRSLWIQTNGSPTSGLRAVVHRWGDPDKTNYCTPLTSNGPMAVTAFNTSCWDGTGTPLTLADVPNLDWIGVQVVSGPSAIKVNLCLNAIFLIQ